MIHFNVFIFMRFVYDMYQMAVVAFEFLNVNFGGRKRAWRAMLSNIEYGFVLIHVNYYLFKFWVIWLYWFMSHILLEELHRWRVTLFLFYKSMKIAKHSYASFLSILCIGSPKKRKRKYTMHLCKLSIHVKVKLKWYDDCSLIIYTQYCSKIN